MLGAWDVVPTLDSLRAGSCVALACSTTAACRPRGAGRPSSSSILDFGARVVLSRVLCSTKPRAKPSLVRRKGSNQRVNDPLPSARLSSPRPSFGFINRSRGGVPVRAPQCELIR
jgi:hypothetical protein